MDNYLFVYGLFRDAARPMLGKIVSVGRASVSGHLYRVNESYPGYVPSKESEVWGDVYRVDGSVLPDLDEFEGPEFERRKVTTSLGIECWVYVYKDPVAGKKRIRGGDWMLR